MKFIVFAAATALALAACSPPSSSRTESAPVIELSEQARSEMERVNAARLTTEIPETMLPRAEPEAAAPASK